MRQSHEDSVVLLDFDGVLFDTRLEVFALCTEVARRYDGYRDDVEAEEFFQFRRHLKDAWQFNLLYSSDIKRRDDTSMQTAKPTEKDHLFASRLFKVRAEMRDDTSIKKFIRPHVFFNKISNLLIVSPENFRILSTRNDESIIEILKDYGITDLKVYGQSMIRAHGSKLKVVMEAGILTSFSHVIYIDDMQSHLDAFLSTNVECHQADWGYDQPGPLAIDYERAINLVGDLVSLEMSSLAY